MTVKMRKLVAFFIKIICPFAEKAVILHRFLNYTILIHFYFCIFYIHTIFPQRIPRGVRCFFCRPPKK